MIEASQSLVNVTNHNKIIKKMSSKSAKAAKIREEKLQAAEDLLFTAARHYFIKDYEACIKIHNKALAINPRSAAALSFRAQCYKNLGRLEEALADTLLALEINPKVNYNANARAIDLCFMFGDLEKAEMLIDRTSETYLNKAGAIKEIREILNKMKFLEMELQGSHEQKGYNDCLRILDLLLETGSECSRYKNMKSEIKFIQSSAKKPEHPGQEDVAMQDLDVKQIKKEFDEESKDEMISKFLVADTEGKQNLAAVNSVCISCKRRLDSVDDEPAPKKLKKDVDLKTEETGPRKLMKSRIPRLRFVGNKLISSKTEPALKLPVNGVSKRRHSSCHGEIIKTHVKKPRIKVEVKPTAQKIEDFYQQTKKAKDSMKKTKNS